MHAGDVRYYRPGNRVAFCCVGSVAIGRPSSPSAIVSRMRADSRTVIANRRVALMRHNRVTYPTALGYAIKAWSSSRGNTCPRDAAFVEIKEERNKLRRVFVTLVRVRILLTKSFSNKLVKFLSSTLRNNRNYWLPCMIVFRLDNI